MAVYFEQIPEECSGDDISVTIHYKPIIRGLAELISSEIDAIIRKYMKEGNNENLYSFKLEK